MFPSCLRQLIDASRLFDVNPVKKWLRVNLPLMIPGVAVSVAVIFALTASELDSTMLVIPPGCTTLMVTIYNYMHYGSSSSVAALGLALLLITMTGILILYFAGSAALFTWRFRK